MRQVGRRNQNEHEKSNCNRYGGIGIGRTHGIGRVRQSGAEPESRGVSVEGQGPWRNRTETSCELPGAATREAGEATGWQETLKQEGTE